MLKLDQPDDAEPILRERLTLLENSGGRCNPAWIVATTNLADALRRTMNYAEAESLLLEALKSFGIPDGEEIIEGDQLKQRLDTAIRLLIEIYDDTQQPGKAAQWSAQRLK